MYVVRPIYFQKDSVTINRVLLVFDTDKPMIVREGDRNPVAPNFAIPHRSVNMIDDIRTYFASVGISEDEWRLTPPVHASYKDMDFYIENVDVVRIQ